MIKVITFGQFEKIYIINKKKTGKTYYYIIIINK